MKSIVINIGGSVVFSGKIDKTYIQDLKDLLIKISRSYKTYIIIGGGKIARQYIEFGRSQNLNEKTLDEIGIDVGLDQHHKIWIYEVNWRPGCPPTFYLELDVVKNTIQYALYLTKNQQKIKEDIERVKVIRENINAIPTIAVTGSA